MLERKSLESYKSYNYNFIIQKEELDGDIWYIAYTEELGKYACYGQGNTPDEALQSLIIEKDEFIEFLYNEKSPIPLPITVEDEGLLSGVFSVRTSPQLHSSLARQAKQESISLNHYVNILLATKLAENKLSNKFGENLMRIEQKLDDHHRCVLSKLNYRFKSPIKHESSITSKEDFEYLPESDYFLKRA